MRSRADTGVAPVDDERPQPALAGLLAYLVPVLSALLIFRRLVWGQVVAGGDLHTYFFPYWQAAARSLAQLKLPLWNTYLFAGAPLLANSQMGAFYPPNWLFWAASGAATASVAHALHWSVVLHCAFAGISMAHLVRRLGCSAWAACLAGVLYLGSGFLGVHVEHLNQLQALAWLPLVFLWRERQRDSGVIRYPSPIAIGALAMILLAGHTQSAFLAVSSLVIWYALLGIVRPSGSARSCQSGSPEPGTFLRASRARQILAWLQGFTIGLAPFALALVLAAAQLLPTIELSTLSARGGGLEWREAVSFSVPPWKLPDVLLPSYLVSPLLPEGAASLGFLGTLAALYGLWVSWRERHASGLAASAVAGFGLLAALGGYNPLYLAAVRLGVPGIVHFRAPSRFLALYVLGAALLAGLAFDRLTARMTRPVRRITTLLVLLIAVAESTCAAEAFPHADATVLRSYTDLRPATAFLVSTVQSTQTPNAPPARVLSISQTLFDPGDKVEIEGIYASVLSPDALWSYLVAAKQREVLVPNLPLALQVPAADGYDGGLLPLRHYTEFTRLFLPEATLDGRLRENLKVVPDPEWLGLLGIGYVVTDKTGDVWVDGVLYDRQFQPHLSAGQQLCLGWVPEGVQATGISFLYQGSGELYVTLGDGSRHILDLRLSESNATSNQASWGWAARVTSICFVAAPTGITLSGVSLLDENAGSFYPLAISGALRLVHSGDVKIYASIAQPSRAFAIHRCILASSDADALRIMSDSDFDPSEAAVLLASSDFDCQSVAVAEARAGESVSVVGYHDTRVVLEARLQQQGLVVLKDAWYPGWRASYSACDGTGPTHEASILRADLMMRAVALPSGCWQLTLTYQPVRVYHGLVVTLVGLLCLATYSYVILRTTSRHL